MRVKAQISACVRVAVAGAMALVDVRFRACGVRFRTGPGRASAGPAEAAQCLRSADGPEGDAGRGREDGAREQPGRPGRPAGSADPDLRRRAGPRGVRLEPDVEHDDEERHLAADRLPHHGRGDSIYTNDSFRTGAGVQQLVPWGGGRYTFGIDAVAADDEQPDRRRSIRSSIRVWPPRTRSRCCGTSRIDATRQNLLQSQKSQEIADVQLRQTLTQTSRAVRNAYFNLVNAIGQLQVAQKSLELAQTSLRNNEKKVELGTMAPIDIVQAEAEVARTEEQVIVAEGQIQIGGGRPARAHHEPVAAGLLDDEAGAGRAADARAAAARRRRRHRERAGEPHRPRSRRASRSEQTDISMKYLRNQKLPALDVIGATTTCSGVAGHAVRVRPRLGRHSRRRFSVSRSAASRDALRDVFANDFKTWSVVVQPQLSDRHERRGCRAGAGAAAARPADDQSPRSRDDRRRAGPRRRRGRSRPRSSGSRRRRKRAQLAEQNLQAEEKRLAVGLSDTFRRVPGPARPDRPAEQRAARHHRLQPGAD